MIYPKDASLSIASVYLKRNRPNGTIDKYKARLLISYFSQKKVVEYFDTYSLVT